MKITFRFFGIISAMLTVFLLSSCTPQVNAEVTIESVTLTEETKAKLSKIVVGSKVELVSMIKYSDGQTKTIAKLDKKLKYKILGNSCKMALDDRTLCADFSGHETVIPIYEGVGENRFEKFEFDVSQKEPLRLDGIEASPKFIALQVNSSKTLSETVTAKYSNGTTKAVKPIYKSNDTQENFIKLAGLSLQGVAAGKTTITVTFEGKTDTINVTVSSVIGADDVLKDFTVTPSDSELNEGNEIDLSTTLTAKAVYKNAGTMPVTPSYVSGDNDTAMVTGTMLKAIKSGSATLTAAYTDSNGNSKTATVNVKVNPPVLDRIELGATAKNVSVTVGRTVELQREAIAHYSNGNTKSVTVTYTMAENDYASLKDYTVTGKSVGNATAAAHFEGKTDTVNVTVGRATDSDAAEMQGSSSKSFEESFIGVRLFCCNCAPICSFEKIAFF